MISPRCPRPGRIIAVTAVLAAMVSLVVATPATASHFDTRATAADVRAPLLGINATFADVTCPPSPQSASAASLNVPGLVTANTLAANCDSEDAMASIQNATLLGVIQLGLIQSQCKRMDGGATGSSSVVVLNNGGNPSLPTGTISAPLTVNLGATQIRLNQQFTDNDGNLNVVAVGIRGPGNTRIALAQVQCANVYPLSGGPPEAASIDLPAAPIQGEQTSGIPGVVAVAAIAAFAVQLGLARVVRRRRGQRPQSSTA